MPVLLFALESKKDFYTTKDSSFGGLNMAGSMGESIGDVAHKMKKFFSDLF